MLPSVFTENLFDEMFDDMFNNMMPMVAGRRNPLYGKHARNMMKTDVRALRRKRCRSSWRTDT